MRILIVVPENKLGGAEKLVYDLATEWHRQNKEVHVLAFENRINKPYFFLPEQAFKYTMLQEGKKLSKASVIKKTLAYIDREKIDIVHTHLSAINYLFPISLLRKKVSFFHTLHNLAEREAVNRMGKIIRNWAFRRGRWNAVTISSECSHSYRKFYNKSNDHLIVNGLKDPTHSPLFNQRKRELDELSPEGIRFLHLGRLSHQKNQSLLLRAFKAFQEKNPTAILLIAGPETKEPASKEIMEQIKAMSNSGVHWLGPIEFASDYLFLSDFFCLSSRFEGLPISLLEAMATYCLPICTSVGGIPELLEDVIPLADPKMEKSYIELMQELSKENREAEKIELRAKYLDKYSIIQCANAYKAAFKSSRT